jgi:hypothetical protein
VAAIQLAMDHFLPLGIQLSPEHFRFKNACEFQRESYDAITTPGPEGVMLVRFIINQAACPLTKSGMNMTTGQPDVDVFTYAIDIRTWRILSIDVEPMRPVKPVPEKKE